MSSLLYFIKEAFVGFKRNFGSAFGSIVTIFLSLFVIGLFFVGGVLVENVVSSIESEVSITCYIADEASQEDIKTLQSTISNISGVKNVTFVTKEEALENFRKSMTSNPEIVAQLDSNPLPASLEVELLDPQNVVNIANTIEGTALFAQICDNPADPSDSIKYGQKTVENLLNFIKYIRIVGVAVVALLVLISLIFITNTIRLAIMARRKEISIMRLVGASNGFIRGPFLMEGVLHSIIGTILAVIGLELVRNLALPRLSQAMSWWPVGIDPIVYVMIYLLLLVFGLVIGLIGSALAMRKYLKV